MKILKDQVNHIIFVVLLIAQFQFAQATTVSQVLNNLRAQNFSEKTLNFIENLLENFAKEDDRFDGHISQKTADKKVLKKICSSKMKRFEGEEKSKALAVVRQMLNLENFRINPPGKMSVIENVEYAYQKALYNIIASYLFKVIVLNKSKIWVYIQEFFDEISGKNNGEKFSPKKSIINFASNVDTDNIGKAQLIENLKQKSDDLEIFLPFFGRKIEECGKEIFQFSRSKTKFSQYELYLAIKKLLFKLLICCETRLSKIETALFAYIAYQGMFCQVNLIGYCQEKILQDFEQFLTLCLSDCLPQFNKDLTKKVYSIKDYDGCWFGGDDSHQYVARRYYGSDDEGEEYPWWVYAPKDTYNRNTVFEYP